MHKMAIETLNYDLTVWSDQDTFFANGNPLQAKSQNCLSPNLSYNTVFGEEWNSQLMKDFWESFESDLHYEPDVELEVMSNRKDCSQTVTKIPDEMDSLYMNASAFLSPQSMGPSSPAEYTIDDNLVQNSMQNNALEDITIEEFTDDLENTSAMLFLNKILEANSTNDEFNKAVEYFSGNSVSTDDDIQNDAIEHDAIISKSEQLINELIANQSIAINKRSKRKSVDSIDSYVEPNKRSKANKRSKKVSPDIKKERKKNQNKTAANRYRLKQKATLEVIEKTEAEESKINDSLKSQLEKLQMEFKVLFPLAKTAFTSDPNKSLMIELLSLRCSKNNLLESY